MIRLALLIAFVAPLSPSSQVVAAEQAQPALSEALASYGKPGWGQHRRAKVKKGPRTETPAPKPRRYGKPGWGRRIA